MYQFAGVFFHVKPLYTDALQIGFFAFFGHLNFNPTIFSDWLIELGDLIILGQIGIKILLAIKLTVLGNVQVEGKSCFYCILEHLLIKHWQGAGQATHHRVDVGVGGVAEGGGGAGENLAGGAQLHMGLQANHRLPRELRGWDW